MQNEKKTVQVNFIFQTYNSPHRKIFQFHEFFINLIRQYFNGTKLNKSVENHFQPLQKRIIF